VGVTFADQFPATAWIWRQITSRWARRILLSVATALFVTTVALRVYAAMWEHRVNGILSRMSQLQLDQTTEAELLTRLPELRAEKPSGESRAHEDCYTINLSNWPDGLLSRLFNKVQSKSTYKMGHWLGLRFWVFSADIRLRQKRVHNLSYNLVVDDGTYDYPDFVNVWVRSVRGYGSRNVSSIEDQSPDYRVRSYFKWPRLTLRVEFTPHAPPELAHHAFDIRLNCIWSLRGCQTARDLLPLSWQDKEDIKNAALARLRSSNPCPDTLLLRMARDVANILLVEVVRVRPELKQYEDQQTRTVDYRLLDVLKGKVDRPLAGVDHPVTISMISWADSDFSMPNPALKLLTPGTRVLLFSGSGTGVGAPCEVMAATPAARQTLKLALESKSSQVEENERSRW
jgi:hypothetical protein